MKMKHPKKVIVLIQITLYELEIRVQQTAMNNSPPNYKMQIMMHCIDSVKSPSNSNLNSCIHTCTD